MSLDDVRKNWDALGTEDPLWAVLTDDRYHGGLWDEDAFFATGAEEIAGVVRDLDRLGKPKRRGRCLDFGCGVGRLTQALAAHFESCDGVDIAPSMIAAPRRLDRSGGRCSFHVNDAPDLALFPAKTFDFVYSNIVLQHMPPEAAKAYVLEFLRVLAPGGLAMFEIPSENIKAEVLERERLPDAAHAAVISATLPARLAPGQRFTLEARVRNAGPAAWPAPPNGSAIGRIRFGNHWWRTNGDLLSMDDGRTDLPRLAPGAEATVPLEIRAPVERGTFRLELDVVQEGIAWFPWKGSPTLSGLVCVRLSLAPFLRSLFGPGETKAKDGASEPYFCPSCSTASASCMAR
jgi:SAM-dependent methyltransferase